MAVIEKAPFASRDRLAVHALRVLLARPDENTREWLAAYAVGYVISFLRTGSSRLYYRFREPFRDVVTGVADVVVAQILRPLDVENAMVMEALRKDITSILSRTQLHDGEGELTEGQGQEEARDASVSSLAEVSDLDLVQVFRAALRSRANQQIFATLKRDNPPLAREARNLRDAIRTTPDLSIVSGARARFIVSLVSDLSQPPIDPADIRASLASGYQDAPTAIRILKSVLVPTKEHGGYAYLLDVAEVIRDLRVAAAASRFLRSVKKAATTDDLDVVEPVLSVDPDFTTEDRIRAFLGMLISQAARFRKRDMGRHPEWRGSVEIEQAYAVVAAAAVGKRIGIIDPNRDSFSRESLFREVAPECSVAEYEARHESRVNTLVNRLHRWWEEMVTHA